jgi:hypothetical protein
MVAARGLLVEMERLWVIFPGEAMMASAVKVCEPSSSLPVSAPDISRMPDMLQSEAIML